MNPTRILLLPGTLCTDAVFQHQTAAFHQHKIPVSTVAFSHQSHVDEMAQAVAEQILPGEKPVIMGFSMGGMVAMALARKKPESIGAIALINSNSHADTPEQQTRRQDHLKLGKKYGLEWLLRKHYLPRYLHRPNEIHQALILSMASELGLETFEAQIMALSSRPDSTQTLLSMSYPTLILGSDHDPLCPPMEQQKMHGQVDRSDLNLLKNCGHFSLLEQADSVSDILIRWYQHQQLAS